MRRTWIAVWTASVLLTQTPCPSARAGGSPQDAVARAKALYNEHRFLEAAHAFEALEAEGAKYLYYAGLAYEALGHDGRAILLWNKVIDAPGVDEESLTEARTRMERARTRTTRLFVSVTPALAAIGMKLEFSFQGPGARSKLVLPLEELSDGVYLESGTWTINTQSTRQDYARGTAQVELRVEEAEKRVDIALSPVEQRVNLVVGPPGAVAAGLRVTLRDDAGIEPRQELEVRSSEYPLRLRRGRWTFHAEAPGYAPEEGEIAVVPGGTGEFPITLSSRSRSSELRPLAIGAGVSGLLLAVGGGLAVGVSESRIGASRATSGGCDLGPDYDAGCANRGLDGLTIGSAVAGAAVGLLITAAIAGARQSKHRRRAWAAQATLGGLLSAGGAVWSGLAFTEWYESALVPANTEHRYVGSQIDVYRLNFYPSMVMVGLGAAALVGSLAGMALERRLRRESGRYAKGPRVRMSVPLTIDF